MLRCALPGRLSILRAVLNGEDTYSEPPVAQPHREPGNEGHPQGSSVSPAMFQWTTARAWDGEEDHPEPPLAEPPREPGTRRKRQALQASPETMASITATIQSLERQGEDRMVTELRTAVANIMTPTGRLKALRTVGPATSMASSRAQWAPSPSETAWAVLGLKLLLSSPPSTRYWFEHCASWRRWLSTARLLQHQSTPGKANATVLPQDTVQNLTCRSFCSGYGHRHNESCWSGCTRLLVHGGLHRCPLHTPGTLRFLQHGNAAALRKAKRASLRDALHSACRALGNWEIQESLLRSAPEQDPTDTRDLDIATLLMRLIQNPADFTHVHSPGTWAQLLQKMSALLWERDRRLRQYHDVAASLAHALRELHLHVD